MPEHVDDDRPFPLSVTQRRLLAQHEIAGDSGTYNSIVAADVVGPFDPDRLRRSLSSVMARHDILRTSFDGENGGEQRVHGGCAPEIAIIDATGPDPETRIDAAILEMLHRPFDLTRLPLFRVTLVERGQHLHTLILCIHHIISDGWSLHRFFGEVMNCYQDPAWVRTAPVAGRYRDFVRRELAWLGSKNHARDRDWWRERLAGATATRLMRDRTGDRGRTGQKESARFGARASKALAEWAARSNATPFMALLAVIVRTLCERQDSEECVFGLLSGIRETLEDETTLGCMINTLCFRQRDAGGSMDGLLRDVRDACLEMWERRRFPYDEAMRILDESSGGESSGGADGLDILFVFQAAADPPASGTGGVAWTSRYTPRHVPTLPLTIIVVSDDEGYAINLEYDAGMFSPAHMRAMAAHFVDTACAVAGVGASAKTIAPADSPTATAARREASDGGSARTIGQLFARQVSRAPDAIALIEGERTWTYRELDSLATRLAWRLRGLDARSDGGFCAAILAERTHRSVIAWIAVLKAGGTVLALPADTPGPRLEVAIEACRPVVVLCDESVPAAVSEWAGDRPVVFLRFDESTDAPQGVAELPECSAGLAPAYFVLTSGSTGIPKVVVGTHAGIVNRLRWTQRAVPFATNDVACHRVSPAFVDVVCEMFAPLCAGVPLVIVPGIAGADVEGLLEIVRRHAVTRITVVPALLALLVDALETSPRDAPSLREFFVSGDRLPGPLADRVRRLARERKGMTVFNVYGSSEVAADVTCGSIGEASDVVETATMTVGRAIDGWTVAVLDRRLDACRPYVPGEVYAEGAGISPGYLRSAGKTAWAFLPSVLGGIGARMYRTGDHGYLSADGELFIAGRADRQIKRRGVRIELDEIEDALNRFHGTAAAAVVFDAQADAIVSYVELKTTSAQTQTTLNDGTVAIADAASELDLWDWIISWLPATHLPDGIVFVRRMPLLPSGKIARRRLASVDWRNAQHAMRALSPASSEAGGEVLSSVCEICSRLVGKEVGAADRLLEIGMDSLIMVSFAHAIESKFGVRVGIANIYRCVTVGGCAERISSELVLLREGVCEPGFVPAGE